MLLGRLRDGLERRGQGEVRVGVGVRVLVGEEVLTCKDYRALGLLMHRFDRRGLLSEVGTTMSLGRRLLSLKLEQILTLLGVRATHYRLIRGI